MARRAPKESKPYNPVASALVQSVALKTPSPQSTRTPTTPPDFVETEEPPLEAKSSTSQPTTGPASLESAPPNPPVTEQPATPKPTPARSRSSRSSSEAQPATESAPRRARPSKNRPSEPERHAPKKPGREKRVILSDQEERATEDLVRDLSTELGTPVKLANLLRASLFLVRESRTQLRKAARRTTGVVRPPNDDAAGMVHFEHQLAQLLDAAIRNTAPLE